MQIVRTEISRPADGRTVFEVLFCGDGDECVSVRVAGQQFEADEAILARARTLLVQTASFGLAANEYDAESNGNFDEVAVTAAQSEEGAVYVFECRDGEGSRLLPPSSMASFEAARAEALRCAVDMLVDLEPGKDALTGWLIRIRDAGGELLCVIDVEEADAARRAAEDQANGAPH